MAEEATGAAGVGAKVEPPVFDPKAVEAMVQGAVRSSIEAMVKEGQTRQAEADAAKAAARGSAIVKLAALGLNDAEIKAIVGEDLEGATK